MPIGPGGANASGNQTRQTFRPPWVKDEPPPIPMPSQPWVKSSRNYPPNTAKVNFVRAFGTSYVLQLKTKRLISIY